MKDANLQSENADNIPIIRSLFDDLEPLLNKNRDAVELYEMFLTNHHLRALIEAHDTIAQEDFENDENMLDLLIKQQEEELDDEGETSALPYYASPPIDAMRMIGIRKLNDEPLGITVRVNENGDLEIARIMHGGMIDKQGLLHEGDIIKEINGEPVSTPEELQEKLRLAKGSITLKVIPSYYDIPLASQVYMKALFAYDPNKDKLIPAKAAGLAFQEGDILQILSQEDIHWWQARNVKTGMKGLVPSLYLEERRKAFVPHENDLSQSSWVCGLIDKKKKKKILFNAKEHSMLDKADLKLYEEVARMPPFQRKTLVLIGTEGIGRRTLKTKLLNLDPDRFGATIPRKFPIYSIEFFFLLLIKLICFDFRYFACNERERRKRPWLLLRSETSDGSRYTQRGIFGVGRIQWQFVWHQVEHNSPSDTIGQNVHNRLLAESVEAFE